MNRTFVILAILFSLNIFGQNHYKVIRLPINTDASEMAPVIYKGGIVYSSDKKNSVLLVTTDYQNKFPYNLYYVEKNGAKKWGRPTLFSPGVTSALNESSVNFSSDYSHMYITRSLMATSGLATIQKADTIRNGIFECSPKGKDWDVTDDFDYNSNDYNVAFPCISPDGTMMFFASNMPGGQGGYDIYLSRNNGGIWSDPENLGPVVNSPENDVFPFYHENGRLYFSSRGHNTQGNLDIFYTEEIGGEWINPINLPRPFNSRKDDFSLVLSARMDTGYFSSNRRGTDDIYMFISGFPRFKECPSQETESFCYYFSETGSMDLDTTSMKYEWDFGDGHKVRNIDAEHCYDSVGYYIVSLNVIDTLTGEVYFSEASYELLIEPIEQPFITAPDTVRISESVEFISNQSEIRSFEPKNYFWDFGDGNIAEGQEVEHSYTSPGEYYIRLGITDGEDDEDSEEYSEDARKCSQRKIVIVE